MTGAPGIGRALRRKKLEPWAVRIRRILSTIVEFLRSDVHVRRGEFPFKCHLCGYQIESIDDRIEWHGLGNCVLICEECWGSGEVEVDGGHSYPGICRPCGGSGWFPMPPAERRPETRQLIAESDAHDEERRLGFPDRPIIPRNDAHFES